MKYTAKEFRALKLSDAIPVYIEEMNAARAAGFEIVMNDWFTKRGGKVCGVCFGGAMMAGMVGFNQDELLNIAVDPIGIHLGDQIFKDIAFVADDLRSGDYIEAIRDWMGHDPSDKLDDKLDEEANDMAFDQRENFYQKTSPTQTTTLKPYPQTSWNLQNF